MFDFSKNLKIFHDEYVRLTNAQRAEMRRRRQANHKRVCDGLDELKKPALVDTINQGGYAQKTMVQPPEGDFETLYDIDMGLVFENADSASAKTTRGWVRDAIAEKATNLKYDPECKPKCVRVVYADGYQCDFPVFRRTQSGENWKYELSASDEWVESDPTSMNQWIEKQIEDLSPDSDDGYQLRRIIRFVKYIAKVRSFHSSKKHPSGLLATALAIESYKAEAGRDDWSLRETIRSISQRSSLSPVYANGVKISDDNDVVRLERFIEDAKKMLEHLDGLDADDVDDSSARWAWKKVFRHSYFEEPKKETKSAVPLKGSSDSALDRLKEEARERQSSGLRSSPWSR
ncbi:MAG: hypothetical protein IPK75_04590 [Acidobacteria bacterium]|nr:hypothetical protein [Acidobacteriota bacterium]